MNDLKQILLVDDNPRDIELALEALLDYNLTNNVVALHDGVECLDYLFRRGAFSERPPGEPVVILLDLKMPKMDGLEVLEQIKSHPKLKMIPVVMMTSSREEADLVKSYQLGVNAYVVKPVQFQQFVEAVRQVGAYWAMLNEAPPASVRENSAV